MTASPLEELDVDVRAGLDALAGLVGDGETAILSGAGISTESGIPDYRGPTGLSRPATPMTFQEFTASGEARQRYWARSHVGWRMIARAQPNAGHRAVAQLQRHGVLSGIITQNVDGLHQGAGAREVIELHGSLDRVICLNCGAFSARDELETRLDEANPGWLAEARRTDVSAVKPDGDVDLDHAMIGRFRPVDCLVCGSGPLKPDVVFFGESVPAARVASCYQLVAGSRCLLVLGSSLTVASGFRFVRRAASLSIPIAIVNAGPTRGDSLADVRIDAPLGAVLTGLSAALA
ncbi:NAD-dependent protein deacetylase [Jatrophihabitans telluris]|uniref:NAD-dependent protein deacetylase n=1 Tax=Jatrophihabitans telluris TaxID=2038343 RepID=A0ABY4QUE5_9ACTN|nr:NAD-dependent protein deacetylase [Jatrophihabitans telluris]UQX87311.1 NAD-dependent protein deacetylase [Jatrophihabitans telluris]